MNSDTGIYLYTGPAVSLIFAAAFSGAWAFQKHRRYILLFATTFVAFALASLSQILWIPDDPGSNAMISAALYTFSILCLIEGVMARLKAPGAGWLLFGIAAAVMGLLFYFFYVERDVVARIYAQNFGYGLMFLVAAYQIFRTAPRRGVDRVIFWLFLLFGLHFFPRTILTMAASQGVEALNPGAPGYSEAAARAIFQRSPFWQVLNFSLLISTVLVSLALLGAVVADLVEDLRREGNIDPLTGLANRRGFLRRVKTAAIDPGRTAASVVYCDIDHFKRINDTHGHSAGDRVLQQFARVLAGELRPQDAASRFGGEEFVILLLQANAAGAVIFAERVRQEVELTRFSSLPAEVGVTASFGVAQWRPGEDLLEVMQRADRMVYEAKRQGRNRIVADREPDDAGAWED